MNVSLLTHFSTMKDPRSERNQKYGFLDLISMIVIACMGGESTYSGIASFIALHADIFREYFDLGEDTPSHDCIRVLMQSINPNSFLESLMAFTDAVKNVDSNIVAIDGKSIKGCKLDDPLTMVSAWCANNKLVLGQYKVIEKSNEITAIPHLLKMLHLSPGTVITIDAMGCQREICAQIQQYGSDYMIAVKGNQKLLLKDIKFYFDNESILEKCDHWTECDKAHGRIEKREAYVYSNIEWLQNVHRWPGLAAIAMVCSTRTVKDKTSSAVRYYILSANTFSAENACQTARSHWSIENQLHWRLDVLMGQDQSQIESDVALENMDILRKTALALSQISQEKILKKPDSTRNIQRRVAMSAPFLKQVIELFFHA